MLACGTICNDTGGRVRYEQFVESVRERAGIESRREAEQTVEAFLGTLGERLPRTERDGLEAQLPNQLKNMFSCDRGTDRYDLEEFYNRAEKRMKIGYPQALERCKAVAGVLKDAVSEAYIKKVLHGLPAEYEELFGMREPGPLSPGTPEGDRGH